MITFTIMGQLVRSNLGTMRFELNGLKTGRADEIDKVDIVKLGSGKDEAAVIVVVEI